MKFSVRVLILAMLPAVSVAQSVITTAAGSTWIFRGDGRPALNAPLGSIAGVAFDGAGNLYAADQDNHIVVKIAPSGTLTIVAGNGIQWFSGDGGPGASASVNRPSGMVVDSVGNVYIADQESHRVRKVTPAGIITTYAGGGTALGDGGPATAAQLAFPFGIALDSVGNLYIAERHGHRIRRVTPAGTITTVAGTGTEGFSGDGGVATSARLGEPHAVAVDAGGNIYIADSRNHRIRRVTPTGTISTIAGDGFPRFAGDGGPAISASLEFPTGVAVDAAGNIYIADQQTNRIRRVLPSGIIGTAAGNGIATYAGDGSAAQNASLNLPAGIAVDSAGNLLIGDGRNQRVRRVTGGAINTVAGSGMFKYSGDGAAATAASLDRPLGVAVDSAASFYIADALNHVVRKVTPAGVISTVAGNGIQGFSGDNGAATAAMLSEPRAVAVDAANNLYIADAGNGRVRRVAAGSGVITTYAGGGNSFPGDGGPATDASLGPFGVALHTNGDLLIADRGNHRIRRVSSAGILTTIAGGGTGPLGDGGPATSATLSNPNDVVADAAGNIYIADTQNNRIRKVTAGMITTVAGTGAFGLNCANGPVSSTPLSEPLGVGLDAAGNLYIADNWNACVRRITGTDLTAVAGGGSTEQFAGDGGPATAAGMSLVADVAFDASGNMYIADSGNDRIRKVLSGAPSFTLELSSVTLTARAGSGAARTAQVGVRGDTSGLAWTAQATTDTGGAWLTVAPASGAVPGAVTITATVGELPPRRYIGRVTVQAPLASPPTRVVEVEFIVEDPRPAELAVQPKALQFEARTGAASPRAETLIISNAGNGSLAWTARAETASGGAWLSLSATSGTATAENPSRVQVSAGVGSLQPGVYSGTIIVETAERPPGGAGVPPAISVPVTFVVSQLTQTILLSQTGLLLTAVEGSATAPSQSFAIVNTGQGAMNWTVQASTTSGGNWLSVSTTSGSSEGGSTNIPVVEVTPSVSGLRQGRYSGLIRIDAPGANNSPQFVTVELNVLPAGATPGVEVQPSSLIFATQAGIESPSSQLVRLATASPAPVEVRSGILTDGGNWLQTRPSNLAVSAADPRTVTLQPFTAGLLPGIYRGAVTLLFLDGSPTQVVNVLLIVTAPQPAIAAFGSAAATHCRPTALVAALRSLSNNFASSIGWPSLVQVQVTDDCGHAVTNASVTVSFSSGDSALQLASLGNGLYTGTWRPVRDATSLSVNVRAEVAGLTAATVQAQGRVGVNAAAIPIVPPGGLVNGASFAAGAPLAPGSIVSVFGQNLGAGFNVATQVPLGTQLGGSAVAIGGRDAPLFFSSAGQLNAQIPFELAPNSRTQVIARSQRSGADAHAVPETITLAAVQPACFTINQQGAGQGAILNLQARLVDASAPAAAGEIVQVYCTGLGAVTPAVRSGEAAPVDVLSRVNTAVEARIGGRPATVHFAGLAPGFVGLYQVNVEIPAGVSPGAAVPLVLIQAGVQSSPVTLAVR